MDTSNTPATTPEFDVASYEIADTATLTVRNARLDDILIGADRENPVTIELYSPGSPQGIRALHKASRSAQLRTYRALRGETSQNDADDAERDNVAKLTAFTKAINNFPVPGGPEKVYANAKLGYITKQVEEFIGKYASFSKGPSGS